MATVKAPLMSLDARGQLAKTLIYSMNKGRHTVKHFAAPANPNTIDQEQARDNLTYANRFWALLTAQQQDQWASQDKLNIGKQPTFLSSVLDTMYSNNPPVQILTGGPIDAIPNITSGTWEDNGATVTIRLQSDGDDFNPNQFVWITTNVDFPNRLQKWAFSVDLVQGNGDTFFPFDIATGPRTSDGFSVAVSDQWGNTLGWFDLAEL